MAPPHQRPRRSPPPPDKRHRRPNKSRRPGAVLLHFSQGRVKQVVCIPVNRAEALAARLARNNAEHRQQLTELVTQLHGHCGRQMAAVCRVLCNVRPMLTIDMCTCDFDRRGAQRDTTDDSPKCDHTVTDAFPAPTVLQALGLAEHPRSINWTERTVKAANGRGGECTYEITAAFDTNE